MRPRQIRFRQLRVRVPPSVGGGKLSHQDLRLLDARSDVRSHPRSVRDALGRSVGQALRPSHVESVDEPRADPLDVGTDPATLVAALVASVGASNRFAHRIADRGPDRVARGEPAGSADGGDKTCDLSCRSIRCGRKYCRRRYDNVFDRCGSVGSGRGNVMNTERGGSSALGGGRVELCDCMSGIECCARRGNSCWLS
mmetsp:Transcript_4173/g.11494  ORF Transcript_4173/g.11494 Transcript_4173/m.11494 type:complete len:198 (+) Transcript_4173:1248-1841(+)